MIKGGYKIIDLTGLELSSSAVTIPGIYESIEGNYGKALMLSGLVVNGIERADLFCPATVSGSDYKFDIPGGSITVTSDDQVTYTAN